MEQARTQWITELCRIAEFAEDTKQSYLADAVEGNATADAIVLNATSVSQLARLLSRVPLMSDGDQRIMLRKVGALRDKIERRAS
jgi:hypothetical protein